MKIVRPMTINDAALNASNVTETIAAYSGATTYGDGALARDDTTHHYFESLAAGNVGNALTDATKWLDRGATNRWAMFDGSVTSQTSNSNSIAVTLIGDGRVDAIALLNCYAATARVTVTDATDGLVYDQTVSMISDNAIADWYAWFFEPIEFLADMVLLDLPPYAGATITITLTHTGYTVTCGACVLGLSKEIGDTKPGASVGITDYSVKSVDAFGNYTILERAFSRRASFTVQVLKTQVDKLQTLLASYRAIPVVYVGDDSLTSSVVYGFYKDFSVAIEFPPYSVCTLELEGLT